jgi:SAM-dependent methyltransferase
MDSDSWRWDETLYAGSAPHYGRGRMPYPPGLAEALRAELRLDGTGRLLDVGCGPGSLTLLLAPLFETAVGVDADHGMIARARRQADLAGAAAAGIAWRRLRAEELPADLGTFRAVTFAQSFHWMDRALVARRVRPMLTADGCWIHVHATTHRGGPGTDGDPDADTGAEPPCPSPPWDRIEALVAHHLGPVRRAGRSTLPQGTPGGEEDVMRREGFTGPTRITMPGGRIALRDADDVVAAVFSLSSSAPHLFADRLPRFEADLRRILHAASPSGRFSERTEDTDLVLWRPGRPANGSEVDMRTQSP